MDLRSLLMPVYDLLQLVKHGQESSAEILPQSTVTVLVKAYAYHPVKIHHIRSELPDSILSKANILRHIFY